MKYFAAPRKRWAIRSYASKLPALLRRDYGAASSYTPNQIKKSIERHGLNGDYSCYAISMFSDRLAFDQYHLGIGGSCDYDSMRAEIGLAHFDGNTDFTVSDIMQAGVDTDHVTGGHDGHGGFDGNGATGH